MSRAVPEWIADHDDQAVPSRVKLRIWERCGGVCALTGRKLRPGDAYDFDHIKPLADKGEHRELNLQLVSRDAHRLKTADEAAPRAKADRIRMKFLGLKPKGRGWPKRRSAGSRSLDESHGTRSEAEQPDQEKAKS